MDPITTLLDIEHELIRWIFLATPATDEQKADMTRLLALRDQLHALIDELVVKRLQVAALGLTEQPKSLRDIGQKIAGEAKTIETVREVLGYAAKAVETAGQIASAVATMV